MKFLDSSLVALLASLLVAGTLSAQSGGAVAIGEGSAEAEEAEEAAASTAPSIRIQYFRPQDQRGLNVFEAPKIAGAPYNGFQLDWGAAFTQQFQALDHDNAAAPKVVNNVDANQLMNIGSGFNNANANLYLNAQLAPGIRVALTTYLSSRHHNEAWVKDGYLMIDESPIDITALNTLMDYLTLKVGHFEVNYGDAHFRRSDNGNAVYNPFVGNYIMDSFTTEIGAEALVRSGPVLAMVGLTGGEIRGNVTRPDDRSFAYLAKLGVDEQINPDLRVRLTGSAYTTGKSISNTLYGGDRAGSRYYMVMENSTATESAQFTSGLINPGFRNEVTAFQINPFVKFHGLELFGVIEQAEGKAATETELRTWNQTAADVVYRFLPNEQLYVGGRYNAATGPLTGTTQDVSIDRWQLAAGWFVTPNILLKGEYVTQGYDDFPTVDIRHQGQFDGFVVEGVVSF